MNPYSTIRIVAFIDIVGWKRSFDTVGHEGLVKIATKISKHKAAFSIDQKKKIMEYENQMGGQLSIAQDYYDICFSFVSDSFIISALPKHLHKLLSVTKWDCMELLQMHGLLTRGSITIGEFTHDMSNDIAIGRPLNKAVSIEHSTKMPRIVVHSEVGALAKKSFDCEQLIYYDGECDILNIANKSADWLVSSKKQIDAALNSDLGAYEKCKWRYISEHLPRMYAIVKSK